jgi:predicted ABC-type ATPase
MLQRMRELIENGSSFAFETTCAGKSYAQLLSQCRTLGWRITLIYLWLPSPETAIARVARRVREGGHDVPAEVIRRRFRAGLLNLRELYLPLAHEARIYDNESEERTLIAEKHLDSAIIIHDESRWTPIRELTR